MSTLVDCFGNSYDIRKMSGTGFCGFHAMSFLLTGTQSRYAEIIDDCINVFTNIPELFRLRTNFGGIHNSSLSLNDYVDFMRNSTERVQLGFPIDNNAWCEDAHLAAMSLLYDIAICTYSQQNRQWHVFNESGRRGFALLLSSPGHFDVLLGSGTVPIIPAGALTHGVRRENLGTSDQAWQSLQRDYTFDFVHAFPPQCRGINILDDPVVLFDAERSQAMSRTACSNKHTRASHKCDFPHCEFSTNETASLKMHTLKVHRTAILRKKCDFPNCDFITNDAEALRIHTNKVHDFNTVSKRHTANKSACQGSDSGKAVHLRDSAHCAYTGLNIQGVIHHTRKEHFQTPVDIEMTANDTSSNDTSSMVSDSASVCIVDSRTSRSTNEDCGVNVETGDKQPVTKTTCYICDLCGSTYNKRRRLSAHKRKRHAKSVQFNNATSNSDETGNDATSIDLKSVSSCSEQSTDSRTSEHIVTTDHITQESDANDRNTSNKFFWCGTTRAFLCRFPECGYSNFKRRIIMMHIRTKHSRKRVNSEKCQSLGNDDRVSSIDTNEVQPILNLEPGNTDTVRSYYLPDENYTVTSMLNVQTNELQMNKGTAGATTSAEMAEKTAKWNKGRYICEDDGCASIFRTLRGLKIHKTK